MECSGIGRIERENMGKGRKDKARHILRTGEGQDAKSGRYQYRWTEGGKRRKVTAATLEELREKEEKINKALLMISLSIAPIFPV